jgi:ribosomal protein L32
MAAADSSTCPDCGRSYRFQHSCMRCPSCGKAWQRQHKCPVSGATSRSTQTRYGTVLETGGADDRRD